MKFSSSSKYSCEAIKFHHPLDSVIHPLYNLLLLVIDAKNKTRKIRPNFFVNLNDDIENTFFASPKTCIFMNFSMWLLQVTDTNIKIQ